MKSNGYFGKALGLGTAALLLVLAASCGNDDDARATGSGATGGKKDSGSSDGPAGTTNRDSQATGGSAGSAGTGPTDSGATGGSGGVDSSPDSSGGSGGVDSGVDSSSDASDSGRVDSPTTDSSDGSDGSDGPGGFDSGFDGHSDGSEAEADADGSAQSTCQLLETRVKTQSLRLGCTDNSSAARAECEELRAAGRCVPEAVALVTCAAQATDAGWSCLPNGGTAWVTSCGNQQNNYDVCYREVCNSVVNLAATIEAVEVAQSLPAGTGGVVTDGTYVQSKLEVYTGPSGNAGPLGFFRKQTVTITGAASGTATIRSVKSENNSAGFHEVFTAVLGQTSVTVTRQCPVVSPSATLPYTASASSIALVFPGDNIMETFTRQ